MINGIGTYPVIGTFRPECFLGSGRFQPNGAANPLAASFLGTLRGLFTVTRTAAGVLLVQMNQKSPKFKFPASPAIVVSSTCADLTLTNQFVAVNIGDYNQAAQQFTIGTIQGTAAFDAPNNAGNWIQFLMFIESSAAKR